MFVSGLGLCLNVLLGVGKLIAGLISGSAAIAGDAANNLSDSAASIVTVSAFLLSNRKADKEHPYGHGRYEYIAGLVIGILILFVGFEFILTGIDRIHNPQEIDFGLLSILILSASVGVKLFMTFYYRIAAKKINSGTLKAASLDSIFDVATTGVLLVSFAFDSLLPFSIDGYCTVFVALAILWSGVKVIMEASGKLLGTGAEPELVQKVYEAVLQSPFICGAHDLGIHDYGPGKRLGTVHAEFDRDMSISRAHGIIDQIEKSVLERFGVELVIHVDPIDYSNPLKNKLRAKINEAICCYHDVSIHELALDAAAKTVAFDIKLPESCLPHCDTICAEVKERLAADFGDYELNINFDILYENKE